MEAARSTKAQILQVIHRILCIHLGTPPESFDWQWNDKDKNFHRDGRLTPQQFAEKYVLSPIEEYVCLVHDPRASSSFGKTYTVQYLGNVVGGEIVGFGTGSPVSGKRYGRTPITVQSCVTPYSR